MPDERYTCEQVIDAARTLFVRVGADVPMDPIVKVVEGRASGVGTLYRQSRPATN